MKGKVKIEILGRGCRACRAAELNLRTALDELHMQAAIFRLTDTRQIFRRGVKVTPAVAVGGRELSAGGIPSVEEMKKWLMQLRAG